MLLLRDGVGLAMMVNSFIMIMYKVKKMVKSFMLIPRLLLLTKTRK